MIDFGTEYTHSNITKEFFLENRGRKQMKIQWVRNMKLERKPSTAKDGKKPEAGKATDKSSNNGGEASSNQGAA